jgi:hypothetical protein
VRSAFCTWRVFLRACICQRDPVPSRKIPHNSAQPRTAPHPAQPRTTPHNPAAYWLHLVDFVSRAVSIRNLNPSFFVKHKTQDGARKESESSAGTSSENVSEPELSEIEKELGRPVRVVMPQPESPEVVPEEVPPASGEPAEESDNFYQCVPTASEVATEIPWPLLSI